MSQSTSQLNSRVRGAHQARGDGPVNRPVGKMPKAYGTRSGSLIRILAEGKSRKEASDVLMVSPRTVAFHKYQVMKELQLKTTADLIRFAIKTLIAAA
jgi:DNA-binding CsgD family transcriptional regulator